MFKADVVGFGSAIVDMLVPTSEDEFSRVPYRRGTMTLVNREAIEELEAGVTATPIRVGGGSCANTLAGLASLGVDSALVTALGDDEAGTFFGESLSEAGVAVVVPERGFSEGTGRCMVLVTPDAERTMMTYLGVSTELDPSDLPISIFTSARLLYLEGYLFDVEQLAEGLPAVVRQIRRMGVKVALSLSDSTVVYRHRRLLEKLIESDVDILFSNGDEGAALTGLGDAVSVVERFRKLGVSGALTVGARGAFAFDREGVIFHEPPILGEIRDTTGAGDLFAAGFLAGQMRSLDLATSLSLGQLAAVEVIGHTGARPEVELTQLVSEALPDLSRVFGRG